MAFNYIDDVQDSVYDAIATGDYEIDFSAFKNQSDCLDALYELFIGADDVTGEASGSFTMSRDQAKENIMEDPFTVADTIREYNLEADFLASVFEGDWEQLDILCRQFVLTQAIERAMADLVSSDDDSIKGLTFEWDY